MNGRLAIYLRRRVAVQILALLAVLTAMMQMLELLDVTTEILERGQGVAGLLYYAVLRLPAELGLALPLAVLLGSMTVLNTMARGLEITAMRSSGVSLMRMLGYLLPVLIAFAGLQVVLQQWVLPRVEIEFKQWWNANAPAEDERKPLWANTNGGPVLIEAFSADGRELRGVRLYEKHDGQLSTRLRAAVARWDGQAWQLEDVTELHFEAGGLRQVHEEARTWQNNLQPDEVLRLSLARPYLSTMMIAEVIAGARPGSQPLSYYQTALYRSFTAPLGVFIMLLLALPTASTLSRGGGGGGGMVVALMLGLAFLLCDGIVAALGSSGQFPPMATAIAAPLLFAAIGLARVVWCERP